MENFKDCNTCLIFKTGNFREKELFEIQELYTAREGG